jgi:hypothetical protein
LLKCQVWVRFEVSAAEGLPESFADLIRISYLLELTCVDVERDTGARVAELTRDVIKRDRIASPYPVAVET